jgi:hypothetical protein
LSKCESNSPHSSTVGGRYSSVGRSDAWPGAVGSDGPRLRRRRRRSRGWSGGCCGRGGLRRCGSGAVVHEVGREDPAEIVRGEVKVAKRGVAGRELLAGVAEHLGDRAGAPERSHRPNRVLEEERQRFTVLALVRVPAPQERNMAELVDVAEDQPRHHVKELGRHRGSHAPGRSWRV